MIPQNRVSSHLVFDFMVTSPPRLDAAYRTTSIEIGHSNNEGNRKLKVEGHAPRARPRPRSRPRFLRIRYEARSSLPQKALQSLLWSFVYRAEDENEDDAKFATAQPSII